jgi:hypothetical protein
MRFTAFLVGLALARLWCVDEMPGFRLLVATMPFVTTGMLTRISNSYKGKKAL